MSNLRVFPGATFADHDPDVMLKLAQSHLADVVIIGYGHDGKFFFSSNLADADRILWLLERAKSDLMAWSYAEDAG